MQKALIAILATALLAGTMYLQQGDEMRTLYEEWKQTHGKYTNSFEDEYRFEIFKQNVEHIRRENVKGNSYTLGINQFAAITDEEFEATFLGGLDDSNVAIDETITSFNYPEKVDWSDRLNPIKNQGSCGSCWSFSAVGAFEAWLIFIQNKKYVLGEQQLVDCDKQSFGCDGGYAGLAIDYLNKNGAVNETQYPYAAKDQTCSLPTGQTKANGRKTYSSATQAYEAIAKYPISVSVHASNWKLYENGIFDNCINTSTNHAVVAVGYDVDGNWKIRNSWGPSWGLQGHIWLRSGNTCGVLRRLDQVV